MSISYLKHTGMNWNKQVDFNPAFERVVETGLNAQGQPVEDGEYVRVEGWEGLVHGMTDRWDNSMDISTYTVNVYNPQTRRIQAIASWCFPMGTVQKPVYSVDLADEYKEEIRQDRIEFVKKETRKSFGYYAEGIRNFTDVVVTRGRKVPVGTKGFLFWSKEGHYGLQYGLKMDDGEVVFVAAKNCDRDPDTIAVWDDECEKMLNDEVENYLGKSYSSEQPYDTLALKIVAMKEEAMTSLNRDFHKTTVAEWKANKQTV